MHEESVDCNDRDVAIRALGGVEENAIEEYLDNWNALSTHHMESNISRTYTFRWETPTHPDWESLLIPVALRQTTRFKLNYSHSFILYHKETKQYRFFHASENNHSVWKEPKIIAHMQDMREVISTMYRDDLLDYVRQQRPDTKWVVHAIVSTSFYLALLPDFPIGASDFSIPQHIVTNPHIYTLVKDQNKVFNDHLCFFRALALQHKIENVTGEHVGSIEQGIETPTKLLFAQWTDVSIEDFPGIRLSDLEELESLFKIDIDVFEFQDNILVPVRRSEYKNDNVMRLLLVNESHFCLIKDIDGVCQAFGCPKCGKTWHHHYTLTRHEKSCNGDKIKYCFPGGPYHPNLTPLEKLLDMGVPVDIDYVYEYRASYDFETYFTKKNLPKTKNKGTTRYTAKHNLLSIGTSSNIKGFGTKCWVKENDDADPQKMVDEWIDYLEAMSDHVYQTLSKGKFKNAYAYIARKEATEGKKKNPNYSATDLMKQILDQYLHQLPVVGFNSGTFDLNVIKPYFVKRLLIEEQKTKDKQVYDDEELGDDNSEDEVGDDHSEDDVGDESGEDMPDDGEDQPTMKSAKSYIVKRNNHFICVSTAKLKFLDIRNFIAPGFNYAKYLLAYGIKDTKGFFPYEYIDSVDRLNEPLPARKHFYSELKKKHLSEADYKIVADVYRQEGMTSLKELLLWYQKKDVEPFILALQRASDFYEKELKLDMLKDGLSVPGLCLRYLFKTLPPNVYFSLLGEKDKDLHDTMRKNIVGGPSIVFHRYHSKGKTFVRGNKDKVVKTCLGLDMNALYLSAFEKDMPTETPIRYKPDDNGDFCPEGGNSFGHTARGYLEWIAHEKQITIQHKFNRREKKVGPYYIDGFDPKSQTIYEFHGCYYHGHSCYLTKGKTHNEKLDKSFDQLSAETAERKRILEEDYGYHVVEKRECEWYADMKKNKKIETYLNDTFPPMTKCKKIKKEDVLQKIKSDDIFGMVRCTIRVPARLEHKFSEMQPIYKNIDVGRDDIGDFMKTYAENHKELSQPRRTLVASYFGENILLTTPLLKWYLDHGLVVEDIFEIIRYKPNACFKQFVDTVSKNRRKGDVCPFSTILADTFKLLGNSAYGKTLEALDKHKDIVYTDGTDWTKRVNNPLFRSASQVDENLYEIESAKGRVKWNLPLQIGFFTYQYAKLRMLEFYYDFLDKYIDRKDFQMLEMDTDSLYMALSKGSLDDLVEGPDRERYFRDKCKWFASEHCEKSACIEAYVKAKVTRSPWDQPKCCADRQKYDKRTPGLMKVEWEGDSMVCLCPKTYFGSGSNGTKLSCKGLNKHINDLTEADFRAVLETQEKGYGENRGFRLFNNQMYTYVVEKGALSYLYIKRIVMDDGISTLPTRV